MKHNMKKTILISTCAMIASIAFAAETTTTTTSTTTSTGTISEYSPGTTFVVKESSGPVTYRYGKSVTYVTKKGKTLSEADVKTRIKVGVPVSVHYTTEGDNRVISRVEVDED
jgi:maltose-binding protein MalE